MSTALRLPASPAVVGGSPATSSTAFTIAWAALFLNVLTFTTLPTLVPIPTSLGQVVTQGSLLVAVVFALLANSGGVIRPNVFMVIVTLLAVVSLMVSIHNQFLLGSTFRACRELGFVAVLWLLTRWWGDRQMALLRAHLLCLRIVIGTVLVGAVLTPGKAFAYGGRLSGALWPIPPTQVAHYAAVLLGCTSVLWFTGTVRGRTALITLVAAGATLVGTHTRTALIALGAGLLVAGGSLFFRQARVRRTAVAIVLIAVTVATFFAPLVLSWLSRGQTAQEATQLTGRTKVWSAIAALERPPLEAVFGSGLSNKSFGGLPIDSNWLAVYVDQGWFGVAVDVAMVVVLVLLALVCTNARRRALALFLVMYSVAASFTETGFGDPSPYLLELFVAGALVVAPNVGSPEPTGTVR